MDRQLDRTSQRAIWLITLLIATLTLAFQSQNDPGSFMVGIFGLLVHLAFLTVGALIIARRRGNLIGWIFVLGTLIGASGELAAEYAVYGLITEPGALPGIAWAGLYGAWARGLGFYLLIIGVLLFFPDGRLPSPRWRFANWLLALSLVAFTVSAALSPNLNDDRLTAMRNPFPLAANADVGGLLDGISILFPAASLITSVAAVIVRFRHARGDEREQIKWLAYAGAIGACIVVGLLVIVVLQNTTGPLGALFFNLALVGIPIAVGIAILKYRLYDIDLIIRRTLVYAVLTAMLALVYFLSVALLGEFVRAVTGEQQSDLVIVVSTLGIAALFNPMRRRIRGAMDRRFYRRKYNAARVLERFGTTVRDEVDLSRLKEELLSVVSQTMQPAHVSLWVKVAHEERRRTPQ